jgi:hypothetical protein
VFAFGERWYALREARLDEYLQHMVERSGSWRTVHVPAEAFARISRPFMARAAGCASAPASPAAVQA